MTKKTLYTGNYLKRLFEMLGSGGVITIWSAAISGQLKENLTKIFGKVEEIEVTDHNGEGKTISALIYICKKTKNTRFIE